MTRGLSPAHTALLGTVPVGTTAIVTADVPYQSEGAELLGYLAVDSALDGPRPGVLVIHDWLGIGEYVRVRCQMLARMGLVAFAPDIYGKYVRPGPAEAPAVAGSFYGNPALMRDRVLAGLEVLRGQPSLDEAKVAAIGFCFGGSVALALAGTGADIAGVVSFHGGLSPISVQDAARIKAKILVLTGAADPVVPDEAVLAFENSLRTAPGVDWQLTSYSGAMHAFTLPEVDDPEHGARYQPQAARRSWTAMKNFFGEIFEFAV